MYNERLRNRHREEQPEVDDKGRIRTEALWINPTAAVHTGRQLTLF